MWYDFKVNVKCCWISWKETQSVTDNGSCWSTSSIQKWTMPCASNWLYPIALKFECFLKNQKLFKHIYNNNNNNKNWFGWISSTYLHPWQCISLALNQLNWVLALKMSLKSFSDCCWTLLFFLYVIKTNS